MNQQPVQPTQPTQPMPPPPMGQPPAKKSNTGLIIAIVIIVIVVLGGLGAFLLFRGAKNTVTNAIKALPSISPTGSSYTSSATTTSSPSSGNKEYAEAKDNTPTNAVAVEVNNDLKAVLTQLFSGAKLDTWAATTDDSVNLAYVTQKAISTSDYNAFEAAVVAKGYAKTGSTASSDGFMFLGKKGSIEIVVNFISSSPNMIVVGADKSTD